MNMNKSEWDYFWKNEDYPLIRRIAYDLEGNMIKKVIKKLKISKNAKILDFGCGEGRTLEFLRNAGLRNSIGIDYSEEAIKRATSRGLKKGKDIFLAKDLKLEKYDIIFSEGLLEHYSDMDEILKIFKKCSKKIIIVQPLYDSIIFNLIDFITKLITKFRDHVKENRYKIKDYNKVFRKHGFKNILIQTTHNFPILLDSSVIMVYERIE